MAIGYRKDLVGGTPESFNDLFDPKLKGKVTMLTEMRRHRRRDHARDGRGSGGRTAPTLMLETIEKIERRQKSGQIRRFTGNDYIRDLTREMSAMSLRLVWRCDLAQVGE